MPQPTNCPRCNGEREPNGDGGAICFFCGMEEHAPSALPERLTTAHVDALRKQARYDAHYVNRDWDIDRWSQADAREVVERARRLARLLQALDRACRGGKPPSDWKPEGGP